MNFWMALWKVVFVVAVAVFAVMAVWVTVAGLGDIRKLFAAIEKSHREEGE